MTVYWQRRRRRAVVKVWFRNSRIVVTEYFLGETAKDMQHILNHPTLRWPVLGDDEDTPHPIMWYPKSADEGNGKGNKGGQLPSPINVVSCIHNKLCGR